MPGQIHYHFRKIRPNIITKSGALRGFLLEKRAAGQNVILTKTVEYNANEPIDSTFSSVPVNTICTLPTQDNHTYKAQKPCLKGVFAACCAGRKYFFQITIAEMTTITIKATNPQIIPITSGDQIEVV